MFHAWILCECYVNIYGRCVVLYCRPLIHSFSHLTENRATTMCQPSSVFPLNGCILFSRQSCAVHDNSCTLQMKKRSLSKVRQLDLRQFVKEEVVETNEHTEKHINLLWQLKSCQLKPQGIVFSL